MKTAVAMHGCHVYARDWERIIWGDPKRMIFGRAAKAIHLAWYKDAEMISFSTGASEKDGKKEAQLIYEYALGHIEDMTASITADSMALRKWLQEKHILDIESLNTADEMQYLARNCTNRTIEELYLVSSPWHIPRCYANACAYKAAGSGFQGIEVFASASDQDIFGAKDITILEPPHRGDDEMLQARDEELPHIVARGLFGLDPEKRKAATWALQQAIKRLKGDVG